LNSEAAPAIDPECCAERVTLNVSLAKTGKMALAAR